MLVREQNDEKQYLEQPIPLVDFLFLQSCASRHNALAPAVQGVIGAENCAACVDIIMYAQPGLLICMPLGSRELVHLEATATALFASLVP